MRVLLPLLLCAGVALVSTIAKAAIPPSERAALIDLYSSTNGSGWTDKTNWMGPAGTECTWYGIFCDSGQTHVGGIFMPANNLVGTIPPLSALASLTTLVLSSNQLQGSIPSLSAFPNLLQFEVSQNSLTGSIPPLTGLTNLQYFDVSRNRLSGPIPPLNGLTQLKVFFAYGNQVTGAIPSLDGLASLESFQVSDNQLSGQIPPLTGLVNLQYLGARNNFLSGAIPALSGQNLVSLDLTNNQLTGPLPPRSDLTNLELLTLDHNQLTGPIPSLAGLSNLRYVSLNNNQLTGPIPSLSDTGVLNAIFSFNQLTGTLPPLNGATHLEYFFATDNQLTGSIPSLSGLTNLHSLQVANNQLTGSIPALMGLPSLDSLILSGNQLTGAIPSLSGVPSLHVLQVDSNQLTGDVPAVPSPNALLAGWSRLCPNHLNQSINVDWNIATGASPWYRSCTPNYGGVFKAVEPCRIMDTRIATVASGVHGPVHGNLLYQIPGFIAVGQNWGQYGGAVASDCGLTNPPGSAIHAITLVTTILNPNFDSYLGVSDVADFATTLSTVALNYTAGQGLSTMYVVPQLGTNTINFALPNGVTADLIFDVVGYSVLPDATALECKTQSSEVSTLAASGGIGSATSPVCDAGFSLTSGSCDIDSSSTSLYQHTAAGQVWLCSAVNSGASAAHLISIAICCRVPGK